MRRREDLIGSLTLNLTREGGRGEGGGGILTTSLATPAPPLLPPLYLYILLLLLPLEVGRQFLQPFQGILFFNLLPLDLITLDTTLTEDLLHLVEEEGGRKRKEEEEEEEEGRRA